LINLLFLGHNLWTRNVRKPIKDSKDSDYSLVFSKSLSKKIPSYGWCPELPRKSEPDFSSRTFFTGCEVRA